MTAVSTNSAGSPCGGCAAAAAKPAPEGLPGTTRALSLPTIHCQGCIGKVENALSSYPGVRHARVNLTRKRVMIDAAPEVTTQELVAVVTAPGFEAHELDTSALNQTRTDAAGRDILMRLAVAGFAAMNVMLLSVAVWSGATDATRDLFHWISAAITLPALDEKGRPLFVIRRERPADTPEDHDGAAEPPS